MEIRGFKRVLAGAAAASALAMGAGVLAPAVATAAPEGVNVTQAADRYKGPKLSVSQSGGSGEEIDLKLTNPNEVGGWFGESSCTSYLMDGEVGMKALIAYANEDYVELIKLMVVGNNSKLGPMASNGLAYPGPNSDTRSVSVDDGVYIFMGTCGGIKTAGDPTNVGVSMVPVIVPSGIGSVEPALNFGSLAGQSLPALIKILPELMTGS